jgi:hypothetical protein
VDDRGYERLAGWLLAGAAVLVLALGLGWWFAAAPPEPVRPPPAEEPQEPAADDLLARAESVVPLRRDVVVYDVTMLNPDDRRAYEVPAGERAYELLLVCVAGEEVLVVLPPREEELEMPCDGTVLAWPIGADGGDVTVRRVGASSAALAIRVTPDG